jgi:aldehyde:ferredoxin oxidoreductase
MQGRLLRVNLSTRKTQVEEIPEQYLRRKILWKNILLK